MELEEFVKSSLIQIMKGVKSAQTEWKDQMKGGGVINPSWGDADLKSRVQDVKFDVAVTAGIKNEAGIGGGIKVLALDFSGKGAHVSESSTVSRISFSVPILPAPITITEADQDARPVAAVEYNSTARLTADRLPAPTPAIPG
jgi:hypothetical protein